MQMASVEEGPIKTKSAKKTIRKRGPLFQFDDSDEDDNCISLHANSSSTIGAIKTKSAKKTIRKRGTLFQFDDSDEEDNCISLNATNSSTIGNATCSLDDRSLSNSNVLCPTGKEKTSTVSEGIVETMAVNEDHGEDNIVNCLSTMMQNSVDEGPVEAEPSSDLDPTAVEVSHEIEIENEAPEKNSNQSNPTSQLTMSQDSSTSNSDADAQAKLSEALDFLMKCYDGKHSEFKYRRGQIHRCPLCSFDSYVPRYFHAHILNHQAQYDQ